jgi:arylformamidase
MTCSLHCGTHVDAPVHFFDGQPGVETVPIGTLLGPVWVANATGVDGDIDAAALSRLAIPDGATRILFRTSNSEMWKCPAVSSRRSSPSPQTQRPSWPA